MRGIRVFNPGRAVSKVLESIQSQDARVGTNDLDKKTIPSERATMSQQSYTKSYLGQLRPLIGKKKVIINAARAVLFDSKGRLLLIRRIDNHRWAMPAGAMELDESIYTCMVREVHEESGLEVESGTLFAIYSDSARTSIVTEYGDPYHLVIFVFRVDSWRGSLITQTDETIDAGFFPLDDLPEIAPRYHETLEDLTQFESRGQVILK